LQKKQSGNYIYKRKYMRNRLWSELQQAKFNQIYATLLIGHYRYWLNVINLAVVIFSIVGAVAGWKVWEILIPLIACTAIAIISSLKHIIPYLIPSEKQVEEYDKIADFYCNLYLKFEYLWFNFENNQISEKKMQKQYHDLKQSEREINKLINKIHKKSNKSLSNQAKEETKTFFKQFY